jgi:hypothetical protein
MQRKVSVLIPTYKRPYFLKQALESAINQSLKPYEIVVCDNDPTPNTETEKIVLELSKEFREIKYFKNPENIGALENYKKLFHLAEGELIQFLPDDDLLAPHTLDELSKPLYENEDIKISAGKCVFLDESLNVLPSIPHYNLFYSKYKDLFKNKTAEGKELIKESLVLFSTLIVGFPMFRKKDVDFELFKLDNFEIKTNIDWVIYMFLLRKPNSKAFLSNKITYFLREHGNQAHSKYPIHGIKEYLIFLSDEFLKLVDISINKKELSEAKERLIFLITEILSLSLLDTNQRKEAEKIVQDIIDEAKKNSKNLIIQNLYEREKREPFSIIIVTYNSQRTILNCLTTILQNSKDEDEIIIIDNNSKDNTPQIILDLQKKFKNIKVILNQKNLGFAKAVNQAINQSKNQFLVIINPATFVLTPDWLEIFYKELNKNNVGIVVPTSDAVSYRLDLTRFTKIPYIFQDPDVVSSWLRYFFDNEREEIPFFTGFCFATRKKIFQELGSLDENLILGMEDFDFSIRLREHGYKILLLPYVLVGHISHVSFKSDKDNAEKLNKISIWNFAKKLIKKYGYGNVPTPDKLIAEEENPLVFLSFNLHGKYKFMFDFSGTKKEKDFFRKKAVELHSKPYISIITVSYFSSDDIAELSKSIAESNYPNLHFVVVDNSEDEAEFKKLSEILKETFKKTQKKFFIIKNENTGFAGGTNKGIKFSIENLKSNYIWILNPDTIVDINTPFELLKTLLYTESLAVTCKIKDLKTKKCLYDGLKSSETPFDEQDMGIIPATFLSGANILIKKELIEKIGYFREDFFLYFEDNDFMMRMKEKEIKLLYTPYTFIYHKVKGGLLSNPTKLYYFTRNFFYFFEETQKENFIPALQYITSTLLRYYEELQNKIPENIIPIVIGIEHYLLGKKGKQNWQLDIFYYGERMAEKLPENLKRINGIKIMENFYQLKKILTDNPKEKNAFSEIIRLIYFVKFSELFGFSNYYDFKNSSSIN